MKKLLPFILILTPFASFEQIQFYQCIYQPGYAVFIDTLNNGNILVSATRETDYPAEAYVMEIGEEGVVQSSYSFPNERLQIARQTSDGGYIMMSDSTYSQLAYLRKLDATGLTQWSVQLPTSEFGTYSCSVAENFSGDFFAGFVDDESMGDNSYRVRRFSPLGAYLNESNVNSTSNIAQQSGGLVVLADSGMIMVSENSSSVCANGFQIDRLNNTGDLVWSKSYTDSDFDEAYYAGGICHSSDGGYMIAGDRSSNPLCNAIPDFSNGLLMKTDHLGDSVWTKEYVFADALVRFNAITADDFGHYYISASYHDLNSGKKSAMLLKTNQVGDTLWSKKFDGLGNAYSNHVVLDQQGNPVLAGYTFESAGDTNHIYVVRTDTAGYVSPGLIDLSSNTSSINEEKSVGDISLFPNPARDHFFILATERMIQITVIDLDGKVMHEQQCDDNSAYVNLGQLKPGIYFVRVDLAHSSYLRRLVIH